MSNLFGRLMGARIDARVFEDDLSALAESTPSLDAAYEAAKVEAERLGADVDKLLKRLQTLSAESSDGKVSEKKLRQGRSGMYTVLLKMRHEIVDETGLSHWKFTNPGINWVIAKFGVPKTRETAARKKPWFLVTMQNGVLSVKAERAVKKPHGYLDWLAAKREMRAMQKAYGHGTADLAHVVVGLTISDIIEPGADTGEWSRDA